jgi:hypothetical protein
MGILDDTILETSYLPNLPSPASIKKTYLFDHPTSHIDSMSPQRWIEHGRIVAHIAKLIGDPIIYKILILLTLTKTPFGSFQNKLENLHSSYLKILQRRQQWIYASICDTGNLCSTRPDKNELFSRVSESISFVDQLAMMHFEFVNKVN